MKYLTFIAVRAIYNVANASVIVSYEKKIDRKEIIL